MKHLFLCNGLFSSLNKKNNIVLEICFIGVLFFISCWTAYHFLSTTPQVGFYQKEFMPAVMQACGRGYINSPDEIPPLDQFLKLKKQTFDCKLLPQQFNLIKLSNFQIGERYLLSSVALIWRTLGITWANVWYLNMLLYGLTIVAAYCVFRLGMNRIFSMILCLCLTFSTLHLYYLPHLRDYSVAPFVLWFVWFLGLLVTKQWTFRKMSLLMMLIGLDLGVGFGFRSDLLVFLPVLIITLFFFTVKNADNRWKDKFVFSLIFFITFFLVTSPIFIPLFQEGSNLAHVTILGLMEPFTINLGLGNGPEVYSMGAAYLDGYVARMLSDYGQRILHQDSVVYATKLYDHVGMQFLLEWLKNFPADFITRIVASIYNILFLPLGFMKDHQILVGPFDIIPALTFWSPIISIIILAFYNLRIALFVIFFVSFFAGYPVLQFEARHFFYLEFISLWCLGFVMQMLWIGLINVKQFDTSSFQWLLNRSKKVMPCIIALAVVSLSFFMMVRWYQVNQLQKLFTLYLQAETKPIQTKDIPLGDSDTRITIAEHPENSNRYLKVNFDSSCAKKSLQVIFKFSSSMGDAISRVFILNGYDDKATIFYPVYAGSSFEGIDIASKDRSCINNISVVNNDPNIKLWPILWLPNNWKDKPLYQYQGGSSVFTNVADATLNIDDIKIQDNDEKNITSYSKNLVMNHNNLILKGYVHKKNIMSYVGSLPPKNISLKEMKHIYFGAVGTITKGGVTIGLINQQNGAWETVANIRTLGKFKIFMVVNKPGTYVPMIANNLGSAGWNSVTIDKLGWGSNDQA